MISRRALLGQLGFLGAGVAGVLYVRNGGRFAPPTLSFEGGADRSGWIDLPKADGFIMLQGAVAGEPIRVLVDSGAQFSAIDSVVAGRLGLVSALPLPILAYGVGGAPSLTHTVGLDLDLPRMRAPGVRAAVLNLAAISAVTEQPFDMLLGRDVLGSVVLEVDYPRRRAAFLRHDAYEPPAEAVSVPMAKPTGGALVAPIKVESAAAINAMVDTGASGALALSAQAAEAAGLLHAARTVTTVQSVGLGGVSLDRLFIASEVNLAGFILRKVPVNIYSPAAGSPAPDGLIGAGLLKRFRVGLDHRGGRLDLTESAGGKR